MALLVCALLFVGIAAGCKVAPDEKKVMLESVAKWYVAQGSLDIAAFKAGIYDPTDSLGVATMTTAPEGATKSEVKWVWTGDKIVVTVPSAPSTITLSASPNQANVILLQDQLGQDGTFVMKKIDNVWKIDVVETQKLTDAAAAGSVGATSTPSTGTP